MHARVDVKRRVEGRGGGADGAITAVRWDNNLVGLRSAAQAQADKCTLQSGNFAN